MPDRPPQVCHPGLTAFEKHDVFFKTLGRTLAVAQAVSGTISTLTPSEFPDVRESLRAVYRVFDFPSAKVAAHALVQMGGNAFEEQMALNWIRRHPVHRTSEPP